MDTTWPGKLKAPCYKTLFSGSALQAVKENAQPMAEELMHNQVKPAMIDAGATAEETTQVRQGGCCYSVYCCAVATLAARKLSSWTDPPRTILLAQLLGMRLPLFAACKARSDQAGCTQKLTDDVLLPTAHEVADKLPEAASRFNEKLSANVEELVAKLQGQVRSCSVFDCS